MGAKKEPSMAAGSAAAGLSPVPRLQPPAPQGPLELPHLPAKVTA